MALLAREIYNGCYLLLMKMICFENHANPVWYIEEHASTMKCDMLCVTPQAYRMHIGPDML